ncbi:MAG: hypothetical protein WDZ49_17285, partial [Litorilinea sp.]
ELSRGGSSAGGTLTAAAGAFLDFRSGTYSMTGTYAGNGAGQVRITGATLAAQGEATLDFPDGGFGLTSGDIEGPGVFTLRGKFRVDGTAGKSMRTATIHNEGLFQLAGTGDLRGGYNATFNNQSAGTFEFVSSASFQGFYHGNGGTVFNNSGTIRKTGTELATLEVLLNNQSAAAAIDVQGGTLELSRGGSSAGGTLTAAAGTFLDFRGGDYTLTGTYAGNGAGQVRITGANLAVEGTSTFNFPNGGFGMTIGELGGTGTLTVQGKFLADGSFGKSIRSLTINNEGLFQLAGTGDLRGGNGTTFNNLGGGTFEFVSSASYEGFYHSNGGTVFNNSGTIRKTGTELVTLEVLLNNQSAAAAIDVQGGTLELWRGGDNAGGTLTAAADSFLDFRGGIYSTTGTYAGSGVGQVRIAGAELAVEGATTFNFPNGGFGMTSGEINGTGTLTLQGKFLADGSFGKSIRSLTVNNEGLFQLGGTGNLRGGNGATFENLSTGTFEFISSASYEGFYHGAGGTTFNNSGAVINSGDDTPELEACYTGDPVGAGITLDQRCP